MTDLSERINIVQVGMLQVNCYLVKGKNGTLYIIDPGGDVEKIVNASEKFEYTDIVILLTHAHVDHITGIGKLREKLNVTKVYVHEGDLSLYKSPDNHIMPYMSKAKNLPEPLTRLDTEDFKIIHTPGHTRGGVCFYFEDIPALFSGDTLFCASVGRTDLPGGNTETLMKSIKEKLITLPGDLKVFPGHGPSTTIKHEKQNNPFL